MSAALYPLVVERAWDTTPRARVAQLRVPESLREVFSYHSGQYVLIQVDNHGVVEEHAYSLCSSPLTGEPLTIAVKRSGESGVAGLVQSMLQPGAVLHVGAPRGAFGLDLQADIQRTIVFVAGGSGITPLFSLAKTVLYGEPQSSVILLFGNTEPSEVMFAEELSDLCREFGERLTIVHVLENLPENSSSLVGTCHQGRIDQDALLAAIPREALRSATTEVFLCGPSGMIASVSRTLGVLGVGSEHIHFESFSSTAPSSSLT
ncbi:MAG: phenylacetate-CoA oxygenase/reductase subunit PaaK [Bacteroidota bacterium]|jgi:ring-1,2-phenylacetyl-CoA epoxidase subunit PaaE